MAATRKQREKQAERAALKEINTVTIQITASEINLQRLAALLLFAEHPIKYDRVAVGPLPWEDPNDPRFQKPPELEIDYEVVRASIVRNATALVEAQPEKGKSIVQGLVAAFGATSLGEMKQDDLLDLNTQLETHLANK